MSRIARSSPTIDRLHGIVLTSVRFRTRGISITRAGNVARLARDGGSTNVRDFDFGCESELSAEGRKCQTACEYRPRHGGRLRQHIRSICMPAQPASASTALAVPDRSCATLQLSAVKLSRADGVH
jgi:hypothetical protein